jgi:hypothetical protein
MPLQNILGAARTCAHRGCSSQHLPRAERDDVMTWWWWRLLTFEPLVFPPRNRSTVAGTKTRLFPRIRQSHQFSSGVASCSSLLLFTVYAEKLSDSRRCRLRSIAWVPQALFAFDACPPWLNAESAGTNSGKSPLGCLPMEQWSALQPGNLGRVDLACCGCTLFSWSELPRFVKNGE